MSIGETVLEMHYHKPLLELFRATYGLAPTGSINFYKYSPKREVFVGFDQAFAMTEMTDEQFFQSMKSSAMGHKYKLKTKFLAYFLQFKVVKEYTNRQKTTPSAITNKPHLRTSVETNKNEKTGFSQHELLFNLNNNEGAFVYYACPMIFERISLYDQNVDLDLLRLVDMHSCPSQFADNSKHYIYFNDTIAGPIWCSSDPVPGIAITPKQFMERCAESLREASPEASLSKLEVLLKGIRSLVPEAEQQRIDSTESQNGFSMVADALTIIRIDEPVPSEA